MYPPIALALLAACSSNDVLENNNETTTQGQTLTINATTGGEDGTRVSFDESTYATKWVSTDKVYIYAGGTDKVGEFSVSSITNDHNAVLTGSISGTLPTTATTNITGYIYNSNVKTSDSGLTAAVDNYGKHIDVDYSEQKGTWKDAMSRCVLFGQGTYNPANASQPVDMKFEYKTTFFKLMLDFGDASLNTTASMCLTGDNMVSNSRINAIGTNAGEQEYAKDLFINIKDVAITNGKATVYVAMYSQPLKNVYLQAVLKNGADGADGDVYDFNISNNATTAITLEPGKVYPIERKGVKQEIPATLADLKGEGTKEAPYKIGSMADLKCMANNFKSEADSKGKYFELTSDIILNGEWTPISQQGKAFRGVFDGKDHTISGNITIKNLEENQSAGLFGVITTDGVIKNLTNKTNIKAYSKNDNTKNTFTGSIVGRIISNGTIENCVNKGTIEATTQILGGLIGGVHLNSKTTGPTVIVEACANVGNVINNYNTDSGVSAAGGIIGNINGCYSTNPNATYKSNLEVKGCYVSGAYIYLKQKKYYGGIVGNIQNTREEKQTTIKSCWVKNLTLTAPGGYKASIISSGKGATGTELYFTLNNCWADVSYGQGYKVSPYVTPTDCYVGKPTTGLNNATLEDRIGAMNTAWGSPTYEFNTDGTIKTKTKTK